MASMNPRPASPSNWSAGTKQSSSDSPAVSLARMPSLFSLRPGVRPGAPRSTMKAEMPWAPFAASVTAMTTNVSARVACVVKVLEPFRRHPPSTRRALVRRLPASLPAPDSVRAQAPRRRPAARGGSQRVRWAPVPNRWTWADESPLWAATERAMEGSTRASSSMQMQ